MNPRQPLPSLEFLHHLFAISEDGVLVRKVTRAPNAVAGSAAGTVDGKGYLHVNILGKLFRVHRLVFFMHYGFEPEYGVDHRDQNRLNNRPSNLRPATDQQNAGNVRMFKHNTSGLKGVSWSKHTCRWHAQIKIQGKQTYIGGFDSKESAQEAYALAAREHFGEYASVAACD